MSEKSVQSIDRTLDIIELLSTESEGLGVTEISLRVALHKSTVHRILNSLAERGYIEKDIKSGKYKIGLKIIEISSLYLNKLELKTEAMPFLRKLVELTGQPAHLAILDEKEAIYIEKVEALTNIRLYSQIGRRIPVYCSALGKALVVGLGTKDLNKLIDSIEFYSYTVKTIQTKAKLLEEIEFVKKNGYAIDDEEHDEGIRCLAAPIYDYSGKVIAAVSTAGDKKIITNDKDKEFSAHVIEAAMSISKRMGFIIK